MLGQAVALVVGAVDVGRQARELGHVDRRAGTTRPAPRSVATSSGQRMPTLATWTRLSESTNLSATS